MIDNVCAVGQSCRYIADIVLSESPVSGNKRIEILQGFLALRNLDFVCSQSLGNPGCQRPCPLVHGGVKILWRAPSVGALSN